jgi:hypothetical protein
MQTSYGRICRAIGKDVNAWLEPSEREALPPKLIDLLSRFDQAPDLCGANPAEKHPRKFRGVSQPNARANR